VTLNMKKDLNQIEHYNNKYEKENNKYQ